MYFTSIIWHLSSSPCKVNERDRWIREKKWDKKYYSTCQNKEILMKKTPSSVKLSYCVLNSLDLCEKEIKNKPIPPLRIPEMKYI